MCMAERIKERRILKGLTQEELGEKLGLKKSAIAKYENGRVENIKRSVIVDMAKTLECSPAYLMGWDGKERLRPYELKASEYEHIQKYRALDPFGQETVNLILNREAARSADLLQKDTRIADLETELDNTTSGSAVLLNAAHERTDIPITDEMKQADDDIMNDENF